MPEELKKVLQYVTEQEDRYWDALNKVDDYNSRSLFKGLATAYTGVRYFIENLMEGE